jgi:hypothetical protein
MNIITASSVLDSTEFGIAEGITTGISELLFD